MHGWICNQCGINMAQHACGTILMQQPCGPSHGLCCPTLSTVVHYSHTALSAESAAGVAEPTRELRRYSLFASHESMRFQLPKSFSGPAMMHAAGKKTSDQSSAEQMVMLMRNANLLKNTIVPHHSHTPRKVGGVGAGQDGHPQCHQRLLGALRPCAYTLHVCICMHRWCPSSTISVSAWLSSCAPDCPFPSTHACRCPVGVLVCRGWNLKQRALRDQMDPNGMWGM
jgi:hypothetical protein